MSRTTAYIIVTIESKTFQHIGPATATGFGANSPFHHLCCMG
jgi:hypothetical protein